MIAAVEQPAQPAADDAIPGPEDFQQNGAYERDLRYEDHLERYVDHIVAVTDRPNIAAFCAAQSRLEVGNGELFSTHLNFANVGNVDSNPKAGGGYLTPEAAADAWVNFIWNFGRPTRYQPFIDLVNAGADDVYTLAKVIQQCGYATAFDYAQKVASRA